MYRQYTRPVEAEYSRPEDYQEALDAWDYEQALRSSYIAEKYPRFNSSSTLKTISQ